MADNDDLIMAVRMGDKEKIQRMVEAGCDINFSDDYQRTPLLWAVESGDTELVECVLRQKASIGGTTAAGSSPLHLAAGSGSISVMECLLRHKADVSSTDKHGSSVLHHAVMISNVEAVKFMVEQLLATHPPGLRELDGRQRTALQLAQDQAGSSGGKEIVALLEGAVSAAASAPGTATVTMAQGEKGGSSRAVAAGPSVGTAAAGSRLVDALSAAPLQQRLATLPDEELGQLATALRQALALCQAEDEKRSSGGTK